MAKPYISDEEAARIDAKAVAGGYKALRAPSRSSWLAQILGKPTYIRSRAEALREERERVEPEAVKALKAGTDVINPAAQGHGLAELVDSVSRIVHGKGTGDDVVNVGAAIAGGVLFRAPARGKRIGVLVSEAGARNLGDPLVLKGLSDFKAQVGGRDWASLSAAERMRIKTRTGWDMSADGLPVTFPDWDISLSGRLGSLSDALAGSDVKKLFKAYPSLKDLNIHTGLASRNGSDPHVTSTSSWFTDLVRQPNVQGKSFGGEIGVSGLHWRLKSGRGKAGLVSHELGHEIQEIEGMSYGGTPRPAQYFLSRSKAAVAIDANRLPGHRAKARRASYDRTARELRRAVKQKARMEQELQWLHELNREGKLPEDVVRREQETLTKKLESANLDVAVLSDPHFAKSLAADAERYANSLSPVDPKATSSLQSHLHNLRASRLHSSRGSSSPLDTYKSLAGEAGARVAEYLSADPGSWSRTLLENLYDTPWDELYHVRYGGSKIPAGPVRSSWGAKPDISAPVRLENYEIQDIASGVDAVMSAGLGNEARQAAKGGEGEDRFAMSRNFLATDKVPDTIFGIPVVSNEDDYTPEDLAFFREHPEAGGYYDMGDEEGASEEPPVQAAVDAGDAHGGDYLEAFARKRKGLVQATAERQHLALQKFRNPSHYESALKAFNAALDSDARDAALLDEYNRLAEASRPAKGQERYDELIEKGRAKYAGGAWERTMASLTSPDWKPPATQPTTREAPTQSLVGRAKEALGVVKDIAGLVTEGTRSTLDMDEVHRGAAALARPALSRDVKEVNDQLRATPVMVNGKIDEGGRMRRATDADRAAFRSQSAELGLQQDSKGGKAGPLVKGPPPPPSRGSYPGKLNNPGNVEKRAERRRGEIASPHERWAKFATPQDGLREMAGVMRQIADVKLAEKDQPFTIRNFAEVYAPRFNEKGEPENDTDKYIRDISSTSGIDADTVLDRWNTDDMAKLLKTVVRFESGVPHSEWFTDDEYRTAARELEEGATD